MKSKAGTYALIFRSRRSSSTQVGHWGCLKIVPGYYIYIGSAFGPGGVQARVSRHYRTTKSKHWHIDYLREKVDPLFAWFCCGPMKLEHRWAQALYKLEEMAPIKGFGCSDCTCYTHLFASATKPTLARFTDAVGGPVELWIYQP